MYGGVYVCGVVILSPPPSSTPAVRDGHPRAGSGSGGPRTAGADTQRVRILEAPPRRGPKVLDRARPPQRTERAEKPLGDVGRWKADWIAGRGRWALRRREGRKREVEKENR